MIWSNCGHVLHYFTHKHTHTPTLLHTLTCAHNLSLLLMSEHFNMVFINFQSFRQCFEQESKPIIINHRLKKRTHKNNGVWQWKCGKTPRTGHKLCPIVMKYCGGRCVCVCVSVCELCTRSPSAERRAALIKLIFMDERNDTQKS